MPGSYQGPRVEALIEGIQNGQRPMIARAITLIESKNPTHRPFASTLLTQLGPLGGNAHRIGITGVPGVGKSTFIEALGMKLIQDEGQRVAVLAVDPSSTRSGGSILADKTRMSQLSNHPHAFVRPSPSRGTLGGVTQVTRETMVIMEAAGFNTILVETVGVGQSETAVCDMVDVFLVLMIAGAGDEFQGIKKGILELADLIVVNKADGEGRIRAQKAASEYQSAAHIMTPHDAPWKPPVLTCSAQTREGLAEVWAQVLEHRRTLTAKNLFQSKRNQQQLRWIWSLVQNSLMHRLDAHPGVASLRPLVETQVLAGELPPAEAAQLLLNAFDKAPGR